MKEGLTCHRVPEDSPSCQRRRGTRSRKQLVKCIQSQEIEVIIRVQLAFSLFLRLAALGMVQIAF